MNGDVIIKRRHNYKHGGNKGETDGWITKVLKPGRLTQIARVDRWMSWYLEMGEIDGGKVELCAWRVEGWTEGLCYSLCSDKLPLGPHSVGRPLGVWVGWPRGAEQNVWGLALRCLYKRGVLPSTPIFTDFIARPDGFESKFGAKLNRDRTFVSWLNSYRV